MPDHTRTLMISLSASDKRVYVIVFPAALSVHVMWSVLKNSCSVSTNEPLTPRWPDGCSGYGGLGTSGSQFGSASVAGFPSVAASRIAVIGLQKDQNALSSQTEMA